MVYKRKHNRKKNYHVLETNLFYYCDAFSVHLLKIYQLPIRLWKIYASLKNMSPLWEWFQMKLSSLWMKGIVTLPMIVCKLGKICIIHWGMDHFASLEIEVNGEYLVEYLKHQLKFPHSNTWTKINILTINYQWISILKNLWILMLYVTPERRKNMIGYRFLIVYDSIS